MTSPGRHWCDVLSVKGDRQLLAAATAVKIARRAVRNTINRETRAVMSPAWSAAVATRAGSAVERAVLDKGARIVAGTPPAAVAANSKRKLRGGLVPATGWQPIEFGAINRNA